MYTFYEENTESFDHMTPMVNISGTVKNGTDSMTATSINGVSEDYLGIKDWSLSYGRNIQYPHMPPIKPWKPYISARRSMSGERLTPPESGLL